MKYSKEIDGIEDLDLDAVAASKTHWMNIAKPLNSLGKLETIVSQIAGITRNPRPSIDKKALVIICADNGVVEEGISQSGQGVTAAVTKNFTTCASTVCFMAKRAGCTIFPIDLGVAVDVEGVSDQAVKIAYGTKNFAKEAAMTREEAMRAIDFGIELVGRLKGQGYSIIATGEMGIGNTTTSSAVSSVLLDLPVDKMTGRGAGLSSEGLRKKISTIEKAIAFHNPDKDDPIDVLSKVGGFDIAGLAGVFLGGAIYHLPIVIDGFISAVAAIVAGRINPLAIKYALASHVSKEPAGQLVLDELGLSPVITADMCLGEGSGAVALLPLIDMAMDVYNGMTTFENWNAGETYEVLE